MISAIRRWCEHHPRSLIAALVLALAAYPAFTASPGSVPADSKLYLFLAPGQLLADSRWSFDARQFAGWVPHQHISFAWPAGPWFWSAEQLGLPDWIAHRLWLTAVFAAAGAGAAWAARRLGLSWTGAAIAAIVYETTPYTLAYVSRTSVMLLPWAGLGAIVALTVIAARRGGWAAPAGIALVVATVGAVNATALVMILPAPLLWLIHARAAGMITTRRLLGVSLRTAMASLSVSLWWITMLFIQRRYGATVLDFSENLTDVSATSSAPEVLRGLGYWLFYVRDSFSATTTASLAYLGSMITLVASFALILIAFIANATIDWVHRRYAVVLIASGVILAVGVHPIDQPSPLMSLLTGDGTSAIVLALRSSTRAVPLIVLGAALLIGARLDTGRSRSPVASLGRVAAIGVVALVALPAWWTGGFVDPGLVRDAQVPDAWSQGAASLDERPVGYRVLQLPGAEFGSFRWGHTVDQPLVALTDRPVVTRDLLPLGSEATMDLVYALDDRIQHYGVDAEMTAAAARLLGVDVVWIPNDIAHERYRSAVPETLADTLTANGRFELVWESAERIVNRADPPRLDEAAISDPRIGSEIAQIQILAVDDPVPVIRATDRVVIVDGSADGILDAASAGLLDGTEVVLPAAGAQSVDVDARTLVIVTDTNRLRSRHWRGSQDVHGATLSIDADLHPLSEIPGDRPLRIAGTPTTAEQRGGVTATASSYGERFSFQPEYRPVMAIDGDPSTAWLVGEHADPRGERLVLRSDEPVERIVVHQRNPGPSTDSTERIITAIQIATDTIAAREILLDGRSLTPDGQEIDLERPSHSIEITVTEVEPATTPGAAATGPVGFSEIELGQTPTLEVVRPSHDLLSAPLPDDLVLLFTRLRAEPTNRWREDPERRIVREFDLPEATRFDLALSGALDRRASETILAELWGARAIATDHLDGAPWARGEAAVDGSSSTAWISPINPQPGLEIELVDVAAPADELTLIQPGGPFSTIAAITISDDRGSTTIEGLDQRDRIALGRTFGPGRVSVRVESIVAATAVDRRYGDPITLPVAIAELDLGVELRHQPPVATAGCRDDLLSIDDRPIPVRMRVPPPPQSARDDLSVDLEACDPSVDLASGRQVLLAADAATTGVDIDQVVLARRSAGTASGVGAASAPSATVIEADRLRRTVRLDNCTTGCWLILAEGWNPAWSATLDGETLGAPTLLGGGLNGWYLRSDRLDDASATVELSWTAQGPLDIAWMISIAAIAVLLATVIVSLLRRGRANPPSSPAPIAWRPQRVHGGRPPRPIVTLATWCLASAVLIGPLWGLIALAGTPLVLSRRRLLDWAAVATLAVTVATVAVTARWTRPPPNLDWPDSFSAVHGLALFSVVTLLAAGLGARQPSSPAVGS